MIELFRLILHIVTSLFKPRAKLAAEILVLRQQLNDALPVQEDPDGEHQENVLAAGMVANSRPRDNMTKTTRPPN